MAESASAQRGRVFLKKDWARHTKDILLNKPEQVPFGQAPFRQALTLFLWYIALSRAVIRPSVLRHVIEAIKANRQFWPVAFCERAFVHLSSSGRTEFISRSMTVRDDLIRFIDRPSELPLELELHKTLSELPAALRTKGHSLAPVIVRALEGEDVAAIEAFNQKLFARAAAIDGVHYADWLFRRYSIEPSLEPQCEVGRVMDVVRQHRTFAESIRGIYLDLRDVVLSIPEHLSRLKAGMQECPVFKTPGKLGSCSLSVCIRISKGMNLHVRAQTI